MTAPYPGTRTELATADKYSLRGPRLLAGRVIWAAMTASSVALLLASIPTRYGQLIHLSGGLRAAVSDLDVPIGVYAVLGIGADTLYLIVSVLVAWLILRSAGEDPMALFVALFLVSLAGATSFTIKAYAAHHHGVDVYTTLIGTLGYIGLVGLFYLFPDGRFVPRWTWIMLTVVVAGQVPFSMPDTSAYNPNSWPAPLKLTVLLGIFGPAVFSQIYRYRRVSDQVQRQQIKWVVYGATAAIVLMFVARSGDPNGPPLGHAASILPAIRDPLLDLGFSLIPLSLGVSVLRYRLWDIDVVINRTLVYGGLTLGVVALYVLVVGYLSIVLRTGNSVAVSLIATGVIAVLFQPARAWLQRGINHLMYGERDEPYTVLSRLGQRLEATVPPEASLSAIVETIAQALKLPYAAIGVRRGDELVIAAAYGSPVPSPLCLPLTYQQEAVGQLFLGRRGREEEFTPADRRLLDDVARQVEVAVHAAQVTAALQRSRERLVTAREEERRRLRRDLHDGLGPSLASMLLQAETAHDLVHRDPSESKVLLAGLIDQLSTATSDIRRLVYNLRPPALDDLGLIGAIRAQARQYGQSGLQVQLDLSEDLPPLPAAVEVATYRIVQEAMTNVLRHANARHCTIQLRVGDTLQVEVADDGKGLPADVQVGVGLASMRARAGELGGSCDVGQRLTGGVRVRAWLPLAQADGLDADKKT